MPRGGPPTYTYSLPAIYLAVPGTLIVATQHNTPLEDIASTLNTAWPVNLGGTGGTTDAALLAAQNRFTATQSWDKGADIASATTLILGTDGNYFHVTGTTTITGLSAKDEGTLIYLTFDGILTLTHNATSLILPTGANITTAAGDAAVFVSEGSGNWRCTGYTRASGQAVVSSGWELIGKYTFNGSAGSYAWTNLSAYRSLEARGFALPGTDSASFRFRSSTNNGSSYDSGASDYAAQRIYQSGGTVNGQANTFDRLPVHMGVTVGSAANEGIKFRAEFEEFNQASHLRYTCHCFYLDTSGSYTQEIVDGKREQSTARDAIEFSVASGVISTGTVSLWGLR